MSRSALTRFCAQQLLLHQNEGHLVSSVIRIPCFATCTSTETRQRNPTVNVVGIPPRFWIHTTALRLQNQENQLSKREQLKLAVRDYGSTVVVFHVAISLASLGFFYLAVSSGLDMVSIVGHLPLVGEKLSSSDLAAGASTFVVAYAVHKCFAPVRISITLTSAPFIVRYLRARGVLKAKSKS